jgi:histone deacetylase 11
MNVFYHPNYNIDLGLFNRLHPFDGRKFGKVFDSIRGLPDIRINQTHAMVDQDLIDQFVGDLLRRLIRRKRYIFQALEVPHIPLLPFWFIDRRILTPMRWAVGGTIEAMRASLSGVNSWNLAGGYHHASRGEAEGFCIYNDVGIGVQLLRSEGALSADDHLLIIDIDAHHGNGNARIFMDDHRVDILDVYNNDIYPSGNYTKERVNIGIPLRSGTLGDQYLTQLKAGLEKLQSGYRLAFVIAGSDVLRSDPLGGFGLSLQECVERDRLVISKLKSLSIPFVVLGGGGYGPESAAAITASIGQHYRM